MAKTPRKPAKTRKNPGKALRDTAIVAGALAGKTNTAIAKDLSLDRETVSKVLKSEDIQRIAAEIDGALSAGIQDAVKTVLLEVKTDAKVAVELLRNFGSMRQSMKFEHTGKDGAPLGQRSDEEIEARIRELAAKHLGKGNG